MIRARFTLSDEYYRASAAAIARHRRPYLRYEPYVGAALLAAGVGAAWVVPGLREAGFLVSAVGLTEMVRPPLSRYRSLRAWRRHHSRGGEVVLEFREDGIRIKGPATEGSMPWDAPLHVVVGRKGLLLTLREKVHYFIPESAFASASDLETVASKFQEHGVRARRHRTNPEGSHGAAPPGDRHFGTRLR